MKLLIIALCALLLTGCTTAASLVRALAKDNASACVSVKALLYGEATACRTNTPGAAFIEAGAGVVKIQHRGAQ